MAFTGDHDDEVIIPVPYWVSFKDIVQYAGGKCVHVDTDEANGFQLDRHQAVHCLPAL